jgi:hypothetical protein
MEGKAMRKADIVVPLGMKIMSLNQDLTAHETQELLRKFFKGCPTIAKMKERLTLNGGTIDSARILSSSPLRAWRTK